MIDALNADWALKHPKKAQPLVAHPMDDDGVLLWLNDRNPDPDPTKGGPAFAKNFLLNYNSTGIGSDANGNKISKNFTSAGLNPKKIYAGTDAAKFMGVNYKTDQRVPDLIGVAQTGSVYGGSKLSKIAEHGGNNINDRHVPIVIAGPGIRHGITVTDNVATVQIAPTILELLGLDPQELQAVQIEKTGKLPGLN